MYANHNQTLAQLKSGVESEFVKCGRSIFFGKSDAEIQFLNRNYTCAFTVLVPQYIRLHKY